MLNNILICGICNKIMEDKDRYYSSLGSFLSDDFHISAFCEGNFHWGCFISWEKRNEFAKELYNPIINNEEKSSVYAKIYYDNDFYMFLSLRTSNFKVRIVTISTGIVIEVELEKWSDWIDKFQNMKSIDCHDINVFTHLIPILIRDFPTKEDIMKVIDWKKKKEIKEEMIKKIEENSQKAKVERFKYVNSYNSRVIKIYNNSLRCPRCQSNNIRLLDRSPESESLFVCGSCCRSFRIEDLGNN